MHFVKGAARTVPVLLMMGLMVGLSACHNFLDVNSNPNAPENARVDIRLPALEANVIHSLYYGEEYLWSSEWTQQIAYNSSGNRSYADVEKYEITDIDAGGVWDRYYPRSGYTAFAMVRDATQPADVYFHGLGKLFYAWTFQLISDLWGPIPYKEAFKPEIREPKYDDQKTVYEGVLANLDSAITDFAATTGRSPGNYDLLFGGDMAHWTKFAHYLKARALLRISGAAGAPCGTPTQCATLVLTEVGQAFASNADDADFIYPGGSGARNPLYTFHDLRSQLVASDYLVRLLQTRNDPRIGIMYLPAKYDSIKGSGTNQQKYPLPAGNPTSPSDPGAKYYGTVNSGNPSSTVRSGDSTTSEIGNYFRDDTAKLSVASYADQKFTEAEARLIVSGAAAADAPYREAITANMTKWGVASAKITAYLATRPNLGTLSAQGALQEIITEKYIANFLKIEPWDDWRRTGYPALTPVDQAVIAGIPQRIRTPASEVTYNGTQLHATGISTGLDGELVKVWWAGGTQ